MTCCKNTKLSLKTHFAFKEAYKFPMKKRPQHRSYKMPEAKKKQYFHSKNKISYKNKQRFSLKNDLGWQKNLGRHWKSIRGPPKNSKSPLKTQWNVAKTQSSLWKLILLLKRPINSNEKNAHSTVFTKCLKPKKNKYFHWKTKLASKINNGFHWKTILDDKKT